MGMGNYQARSFEELEEVVETKVETAQKEETPQAPVSEVDE